MGGLVCYQQSGATDADDSVPGCPGTAQDNVDYCVDKKRLEKSGKYLNFVLQGDLEPGSLGRCQGESLSVASVIVICIRILSFLPLLLTVATFTFLSPVSMYNDVPRRLRWRRG